mgnify:FL=1
MGKGEWGMDDREEIVIEEFKTSRKNIKNDGGKKMKKDYIIPGAYGIAMLLAILAGIFLLDMPIVIVCIILVLESMIGVCLHDMPIWVHGIEIIISIVAGIIFKETVFMVIAAVIYVVTIFALHFMRESKSQS